VTSAWADAAAAAQLATRTHASICAMRLAAFALFAIHIGYFSNARNLVDRFWHP